MSESVLYVDDDADSRELLETMFRLSGRTIISVGGATEALRSAGHERFSLFILDNWLRDGSGIELCRQLRALYPETPIIFLSGAAYPTDREQAIEAGACDYLIKPTGVLDLEATLARLISVPPRPVRPSPTVGSAEGLQPSTEVVAA